MQTNLQRGEDMTENAKRFRELLMGFKALSPDGKAATVKKCEKMGEVKLANALRQIASETAKMKRPCGCANIQQGKPQPTTERA